MELKGSTLLTLTNSYPDEENTMYGGIFVKEQVAYLKDYFKKVHVISPQPLGINRNLHDYKYDNVHVYFPKFLHMPLSIFRQRLGDNFFKSALKVIRRENIKFDLIHAHFTWPSGYAGIKLKEKYGKPLIVTAHGFDVYDLPFRSSFWLKKIRKVLFHSDYVITVSRRNFKILVEKLSVPSNKISIIPNGFDPRLFKILPKEEARLELGLPLNRKIILNVGNLVPVKGQRYLIQAMRIVHEQKDDVKLYIVGDGPLKNELKKYIRELGMQEVVELVGARPHEEMPLWMNAADIFVLSSLSEGNPTVMFEALGVGLPFIGTKVGGIPEIITSEDYGLLCEPANPEDLAEKILIALEKKWDREKIKKYAQQFTWDNIVKQALKAYIKVLEGVKK